MWRRGPSFTGVVVRESCGVLTAFTCTGAGFSYGIFGSAPLRRSSVSGSTQEAASSASQMGEGRNESASLAALFRLRLFRLFCLPFSVSICSST
ncbi:hypothetical protein NDU88_005352 [Pleurodeles waltl]|uniref:Secreted protein n=1 Tax=Pleurodeles waltl TaxID=8319 RepID=A0AAV7MWH1_PLEWA|nr:hypothetical protein NDU88_005352 [Pleurodeles waltl]